MAALVPLKEPLVKPIEKEALWAPWRVWMVWRRGKPLAPAGIKPAIIHF
jgi:hypothetical protein